MSARIATVIAAVCAVLAVYFAIDAAHARRELSRESAERESVLRREADLSRQVAEIAARGDRVAGELARLQAEKDRLSGELTRSHAASGRMASLDLSSSAAARGALPVVHAGPGIDAIRLLVPRGGAPRSSYAATVRKSDGAPVWSGSGSPAGAVVGAISLLVPTRLLAPGDYIVTVSAASPPGSLEPAGEYAFRVTR